MWLIFGTDKTTNAKVKEAVGEFLATLPPLTVVHVEDCLHDYPGGVSPWVINRAFTHNLSLHTYSPFALPVYGLVPHRHRDGHTQYNPDQDFNAFIMQPAFDHVCCIWNGTDIPTRSRLELAQIVPGRTLKLWNGFWSERVVEGDPYA